MMEVCNLLGVKKINTTAYNPQINGLTERLNSTLTDMLAKRVDKVEEIEICICHLFYLLAEKHVEID